MAVSPKSRSVATILSLFMASLFFFFCMPYLLSCLTVPGSENQSQSFSADIEAPNDERQEKFKYARDLFNEGNYDAALALMKELLEINKDDHDSMILMGWIYYRKGDFKTAREVFSQASGKFADSSDAANGLAYSLYQLGDIGGSEKLFQQVIARSPDNFDALKGLAIVRRLSGDMSAAKELFERAVLINPDDAELKGFLDQINDLAGSKGDTRTKGSLPANLPLQVDSKVVKDYLAVRSDGEWKEIFIKGVNLGVALPGKFPAEFPTDKKLYLDWLDEIANMNANAVRIYTLLPPAFYEALKEHNEKKGVNRLWLIQGVWVELPPDNDFYRPQFMSDFKADIARVIDAIYGNIKIGVRPGHASGRYDVDVSGSLLAMILGREWEPFSVIKFNARYPGVNHYEGKYLRVEKGNPMECWVAEICNFTAGYETDMYRAQHPLSFSNWPTLDPLEHPSETTKIEENEIKKRLGLKVDPVKGDQYDDDAVSVDATHIIASNLMKAGFFASYHIYPYHPDFLNNDPAYLKAHDSEGPNNYYGYIKDLKRYHGNQPLLVAEFGMPTSRGISHFQAQGMNHGGHTEIEQGKMCGRLIKDIKEVKCAGGIIFSWIDEWFKKNWLIVDFENPLERDPLWYNAMDPEENYGLLAMKPGKEGWKIRIDGRGDDWKSIPPLYRKGIEGQNERGEATVGKRFDDGFDAARDLKSLSVTSDEGYLYLRLDVGSLDCNKDGKVDWDRSNYLIGIDTYRRDLGDFRFPGQAEVFAPSGMEFMIELRGEKDSKILVDAPYSTFLHTAEGWGPYRSIANKEGNFIEIRAETNRERYGKDRTVYHAISYSRSPLRYGTIERGMADYDSLADWYLNAKENFIEVRIPWTLLNVTDPSSKKVLHQERSHLAPLDTVETDGFALYAVSINPSKGKDAAADAFPSISDMTTKGSKVVPLYSWAGWDVPSFHSYLKDSYFILKDDFGTITTYIKKGF